MIKYLDHSNISSFWNRFCSIGYVLKYFSNASNKLSVPFIDISRKSFCFVSIGVIRCEKWQKYTMIYISLYNKVEKGVLTLRKGSLLDFLLQSHSNCAYILLLSLEVVYTRNNMPWQVHLSPLLMFLKCNAGRSGNIVLG